MKDTQPIPTTDNTSQPARKKRASGGKVFLYAVLALVLLLALLYVAWLRPAMKKPISAPLALPTMVVGPAGEEGSAELQPPSNLEKLPVFVEPALEAGKKPVCGEETAWNVLLVGIDTPSVDLFTATDLPAHEALARHEMLVLEGLDLSGVPEGLYELVALPLRLAGFEASPVRAVLRR